MNTFTQKSLYAALAGLGAFGAAGTANAVHVNPDGLGQVLIYPYYTVREQAAGAAYNSLLSVVNSTASAKAVKVRFLEGRNSREVLDFNLFLSAKDMWTAAVVPTADGAGIITRDKSCILPKPISANAASPELFVNFAYQSDPAGGSLDRTREGYIELIEMGNVTGETAANITHVPATAPASGTPLDCPAVNDTDARRDTVQGDGGLFGGITLINVLLGEDFAIEATALDNFNTSGPIYGNAGTVNPDLTASTNQFEVFAGTSVIVGTAPRGIDAVSAALMHRDVLNEFVLDAVTKSGTDWVVTFPTKRYYFLGNTVTSLFQRNFTSTGSCDDVSLTEFDREEGSPRVPGGFSPPRPDAAPFALCWEANVVTFDSSNVFGSKNSFNYNATYENGWVNINLVGGVAAPVHRLGTSAGTFQGLPVIGFAAQSFLNGTLTSGTGSLIQSNYGGAFLHKYTRGL